MSTAHPAFAYEVEETKSSTSGRVTTVTLHGRLVSENTPDLKALLKPLIAAGGRTILNFTDVSFLDSSALGAFVILKMSSINAGFGTLEFAHLSDRVKELFRLTNLTEMFKS